MGNIVLLFIIGSEIYNFVGNFWPFTIFFDFSIKSFDESELVYFGIK